MYDKGSRERHETCYGELVINLVFYFIFLTTIRLQQWAYQLTVMRIMSFILCTPQEMRITEGNYISQDKELDIRSI